MGHCFRALLSPDNKRRDKNWVCKWLCWLLSLFLTVPPPIWLISPLDTQTQTYNYSTKCTCSLFLCSSSGFLLCQNKVKEFRMKNTCVVQSLAGTKMHFNDQQRLLFLFLRSHHFKTLCINFGSFFLMSCQFPMKVNCLGNAVNAAERINTR